MFIVGKLHLWFEPLPPERIIMWIELDMLVRFASFWIFPLAGTALLYFSVLAEPEQVRRAIRMIPAGFLLWSLLEYGLHRFVFHMDVASPPIRTFIHSLHIHHHDAPQDPDRIFVRPAYSIPASALLLGAFYLALSSLSLASGLVVGLWLGFLYYELVHYRVHVSAASGLLLGYQRRRHFHHHFVEPRSCFGVTSPLWDRVFGTSPGQR